MQKRTFSFILLTYHKFQSNKLLGFWKPEICADHRTVINRWGKELFNTKWNPTGKLNAYLIQDSWGKKSSDVRMGGNFPGEKVTFRSEQGWPWTGVRNHYICVVQSTRGLGVQLDLSFDLKSPTYF